MKTLTFFTREGCHLCEEALAALLRVRHTQPFTLDVIDLDRDASPEKRAAYDWEVPVVEVDGDRVMHGRIDEVRLVRLLDGAGN